MVNTNAARHLLLIVSVLLCFFVYMGYRIWGQPSGEALEGVAVPIDLADLNPGNTSGSGQTVSGGSLSADPLTGLPANPAPASRQSSPTSRPDSSPGAGARLTPPERGGGGGLKPPSGTASLMPPPPSGSIEESATPTNSSGQITGLIPGPSLKPPESAPQRNDADNRQPAERRQQDAPSIATPPASPAGGLKPPTSTADEAFFAAPPARTPAPATGVDERSEPATSSAVAGGSDFTAPPPPPGPGLTPPPPSRNRAPASAAGTGGPASGMTTPAVAPGGAGSESLRVYIIRPGDTLSRIAARELGSNTLANNIFLLNRDVITDPDQLLVGERILLPVRDNRQAAPALTPAGSTAPAPSGYEGGPTGGTVRVHRVARGDTLSSIALRYYGTSAAWRFLFESNRDVIASPNQLAVGTELVVPPYEGDF